MALATILMVSAIFAPANAIQTQISLDRPYYYPGEVGTISITFYNEQFQWWNVSQIGVHFDWMRISDWVPLPMIMMAPRNANNPPALVAIQFSIPRDVTAGDHSFSLQYLDNQSKSETLQTGSLAIHDPNEVFPGVWALIIASPIVGYVLSISSIIVAVIIGVFAKRTRKEISYELLSMSPVLNFEEEIKGNLQITYNSQPVTKVHLTEVSMGNTGNTAIKPADYISPLTIGFGTKSRVLTADKLEASPTDLKIEVTIAEGKIVLTPCLLNKHESEIFKILVTDPDAIEITGRIVDTTITESTSGRGSSVFLMLVALILLILLAVSYSPRPAPGPIPTGFHIFSFPATASLLPLALQRYRHFRRDLARLVNPR